MQSKLKTLLALGLMISITVIIVSVIYYISELEEELSYSQDLIAEREMMDVNFHEGLAMKRDTINRYINNCNFKFGEKIITSTELIKMFNDKNDENTELIKEINQLKDSLNVYQNKYSLAEQYYGLKIYYVNVDGERVYHKRLSTVDSAMILFPYYKHKIKYYRGDKYTVEPDKGK